MKRYYTAIFLFLTLFTGCIRENMDGCPPQKNCILKFQYTAAGIQKEFTEVIGSVDVLIFDMEYTLVARERIGLQQLKEFPGIVLTLAPGDYRVACIGNLYGKSELIHTGDRLTLENGYLATTGTDTGDPLYYSPRFPISPSGTSLLSSTSDFSEFIITIPAQGVVEIPYPFMRIHRSVHVYVKGLGAEHYTNTPIVEINSLPVKYSLSMELQAARLDYRNKTAQSTTLPGILYSRICSPYYDITGNIHVSLHSGTDGHDMIVPIKLLEFLQNNPSADTDDIEILIEFKNGNVTVRIPGWDEIPVNPTGNK